MTTAERMGREVAAIEWVRMRVTDEERRVRNPLNVTEPESFHVFRRAKTEEPCRACLLGWTWIANVRFGLASGDDVIGGGICPVVRAATRAVLDWDPDVDHDVGDPETEATAAGPEVLNEILDRAVEKVLERADAVLT